MLNVVSIQSTKRLRVQRSGAVMLFRGQTWGKPACFGVSIHRGRCGGIKRLSEFCADRLLDLRAKGGGATRLGKIKASGPRSL